MEDSPSDEADPDAPDAEDPGAADEGAPASPLLRDLATADACEPPDDGLAGILRNPIDPMQQRALAFGDRSHWLQPWRGYLETVPATKLRDAIGINIDNQVHSSEVPALARLLGANGFTRARIEVGWDQIDYDDPDRLRNREELRASLAALRDRGIRPLILLNSNHGAPCPTRFFDAVVASPAPRGARQLTLDDATARAVVPGRTGLNRLGGGDAKAADVIFTSIDGRVATLSKPLPRDLSPGAYRAATLLYEPFAPPQLADGRPNPRFERTLAGWFDYVEVVTREARDVLGDDDEFDVEIWNELTFGSDFLYASRYYAEPPAGTGDVTQVIPRRTVGWLRDPDHGVEDVGIGNGFESQRPWASGETSPAGLTAISKHPYKNMRRFPQDAANDAPGIRPLDALGRTAGSYDGSTNRWRDDFVPAYDAFFPEYYLNAIQTEHLIRDLSPFTTSLYDTPHGRVTHPPGGDPPGMWITEWNMDPAGADLSDPGNAGGDRVDDLSDEEVEHFKAKGVLRYLTSWVNKGVSAVHLFAAKHGDLALVDPSFFDALDDDGGDYPGDEEGGETMEAVRRLTDALDGAESLRETRELSLHEIGDHEGRKQFEGDGTAAHPPLYDRDVVGFFPYQVDEHRFVMPVYVMTRDIAKRYPREDLDPGATRLDMPESRFRLTIGGVAVRRRRRGERERSPLRTLGRGHRRVPLGRPPGRRAAPDRLAAAAHDRRGRGLSVSPGSRASTNTVRRVSEQRLWAPWRLEYIKGPKDDECIFCTKPAAGEDQETRIAHRGERCFVILNTYPYNNGHVMVAPYRHVGSLEDLDDDEAAELMALTRRALTVLRRIYEPEGFNLGVNEGKVGGAGFDEHVHQHVVPRWGGDTNFMPVIGNVRVLPESLDDSWRQISEAFSPAPSR